MKYRIIAIIVGVVFSIISCAFTVQMMMGFAGSGLSKVLFVCLGIALQSGQAITISLAAYFFVQKRHKSGSIALALWLFFFSTSIAGTMGGFSAQNKKVNEQAALASPERAILQEKISDIDKQIEYLRQVISDCASRSIISKCVQPRTSEVNNLIAEKQSLQDQLSAFKVQYAGDEIYRRLGNFFDCEQDTAKTGLFFIIALLLDLTPAFCLACSSWLLAFKETDVFAIAELETLLEKKRLQAEKERIIAGTQENIKPMPGPSQQEHRQIRIIEKRQPALSNFAEPGNQNYIPDTPDYSRQAHNEIQGTVLSEFPMSKPIGFTSNFNTGKSQADIEEHKLRTGTVQVQGTDTDIERYIKAAFQNMKQGALCGRRKIGDLTGITQKRCDEIHIMLKKAGLIKIQGLKTFPKKSMPDMLRAVQEVQ